MPSREEFTRCITPFMKGAKSKEERQLNMCIGAKICSGKAKTREEAERLCLLPKEPKAPRKTSRQRAKEQEACDPDVFFEVASQFDNVYITAHGDRCAPCHTLDKLIRENDLPYQVVVVPEVCAEILDKLEVDAFPTVIKMSKGKVVSRHVGDPNETIEKMKKGE